jgi:hypothetical protein
MLSWNGFLIEKTRNRNIDRMSTHHTVLHCTKHSQQNHNIFRDLLVSVNGSIDLGGGAFRGRHINRHNASRSGYGSSELCRSVTSEMGRNSI